MNWREHDEVQWWGQKEEGSHDKDEDDGMVMRLWEPEEVHLKKRDSKEEKGNDKGEDDDRVMKLWEMDEIQLKGIERR